MHSLLAQNIAIPNTFMSLSLKLPNLKLGQSNAMRYNGLSIGVDKMKNGLSTEKTKGLEAFDIRLKFYL